MIKVFDRSGNLEGLLRLVPSFEISSASTSMLLLINLAYLEVLVVEVKVLRSLLVIATGISDDSSPFLSRFGSEKRMDKKVNNILFWTKHYGEAAADEATVLSSTLTMSGTLFS